ncbi:MAG: hypothetical protein MJY45_04925 [Bacteroidales bacterium]|nr:hypothetical protein [Bacteroidales bacterium]
MNDKISIVTGFFSLGRDRWNRYDRSNEKYYRYFEFWANIHNDMVIYADPESAAIVRRVRVEKFGRKNTRIIEIEDFLSLDKELYNAIQGTTGNDFALKFHLRTRNPESWNAEYNYMMLLKEWCVNDAIEKGYVGGMVAWVDFGWNHGGKYYTDPKDFDFEWKYPFEEDKMNIFALRELDDGVPVFEVLSNMNSYLIGGLIIGPATLWPKFAAMIRGNMLALTRLGLMDDDQLILLMTYRQAPEMFKVRRSNWFEGMQLCSGQTFKTIPPHRPDSILRKIKLSLRNRRRSFLFALRWYRTIKNVKYD